MCLRLDIPIFHPVLDVYSIDYIVIKNNKPIKIQVKSTYTKAVNRNCYKVGVTKNGGKKYTDEAYDILVAYIVDISTYFIIPKFEINGKCIYLNPDSQKNKYNKYKEAWNLIK